MSALTTTAVLTPHLPCRATYAAARDRLKADLLEACAPDRLARCVAINLRLLNSATHPHSCRATYAAAWDRLKADLLEACAPDRLARCVAMDLRLRCWLRHAVCIFDAALPSKEDMHAAQAEKVGVSFT